MTTRKIIVEEGIYHVTQRAPGREIIFVEDVDYLRFIHLMKEVSKNFKIDILCFALLTNHLHILLKTKEKNLDKAMKYLFQSYAQGFNKKYERKGHVFSGAYRAALCQDDKYLITASLYIHWNPLKAGLTKDVFNYRWFSLDVYVRPIRNSFVKAGLILNILAGEEGESGEEKGRFIYKNLIRDIAVLKLENILENKNAIEKFNWTLTGWLAKHSESRLFNDTPFLKNFLDEENAIKDIERVRRRVRFDDKKAFAYRVSQLRARGYTYEDIAERLGVNRTTIYRILSNAPL